MSAPFGQPTYADLVQQIADLRDQLSTPLTLGDLPLHDLRSALIENGEPLDLSVLALPGQTLAGQGGASDYVQLGPAGVKRSGIKVITVTWPGGSTASNAYTVTNEFGFTVENMIATADETNVGAAFVSVQFGNVIRVHTPSFLPGAGTTSPVNVLAWGH